MPLPIPRLAPVTTATLPAREATLFMILISKSLDEVKHWNDPSETSLKVWRLANSRRVEEPSPLAAWSAYLLLGFHDYDISLGLISHFTIFKSNTAML